MTDCDSGGDVVVVGGYGGGSGYIYFKQNINFYLQLKKVTFFTQTLTMFVFSNDGSDIASVVLSWEW